MDLFSDFLIEHFRYRPIMVLWEVFCAHLTGGDYDQLHLISTGLHTFNALLFFLILFRFLQFPFILTCGLVVIATFSRFTEYLIMAETGIIESLGVGLCLFYVMTLLQIVRRPQLVIAVSSAALYCVLIHLHERYLALLIPSLVLTAIIYRRSRAVAAWLSCLHLAVVTENLLVKRLILSTPIFMGTTTQAIDFGIKAKLVFFFQGILNFLGINHGPSYLSVLDYSESPPWLKAISVASATAAVWLIGGALIAILRLEQRNSVKSGLLSWAEPLVLSTAISALALSASVTFRQEYRWLYPGYLAFLLLLAIGARKWTSISKSPVAYLLMGAFVVCGFAREVGIRTHRSNFYQYTTCQTASELYDAVARSEPLQKARVITIGGDPVPESDWVFMDGMFSRYYSLPPLQFIDSTVLPFPPPILRYDARRHKFEEAPRATDGTLLPEYKTNAVSNAKLISGVETNLSTPNGKRLIPFDFDGTSGWAMVAPLELEVDVPAGSDFLHLSFSHLWRQGGNVKLEISTDNGTALRPVILRATVASLMVDRQAEWQDFRIPLPSGSEKVHIKLAPVTNASAAWIMLRQFIFSRTKSSP